MKNIESNSIDCVITDPPYFLSNGGITCKNGKMVSVNKGDWDIRKDFEELLERLILSSTNENDLILDMFNGSGTTGVVSIRNKRGYIGIESENDYYTITKKRLNRELK